MKALLLIIAGGMILGLASLSLADDKKKPPAKDDKQEHTEHKEKLVGTWTVVEDPSYKKGSLFTFSKNGRFNYRPPGEKKGVDGTWKIDGDKFTFTFGKITSPAFTVEKVTDSELLLSIAGGNVKWSKK